METGETPLCKKYADFKLKIYLCYTCDCRLFCSLLPAEREVQTLWLQKMSEGWGRTSKVEICFPSGMSILREAWTQIEEGSSLCLAAVMVVMYTTLHFKFRKNMLVWAAMIVLKPETIEIYCKTCAWFSIVSYCSVCLLPEQHVTNWALENSHALYLCWKPPW